MVGIKYEKERKITKVKNGCLYAVGEFVWHRGALPVFMHFSAIVKALIFSGGYLLKKTVGYARGKFRFKP